MHNIEHYTYPKDADKKEVKAQLDYYVAHEDWQEGCSGLYHPIRWIENRTYDNYDDALKAIEKLDNGCYDNLAVLYNEPQTANNKKVEEHLRVIAEKRKEYEKRDAVLYPDTVSSTFIGCKECGSRLARMKLRSNKCPVCGNDLRPDHMLKSVQSAKKKWQKAQTDLEEYKKKHCKKIVRWLVKIEYHT